VIVEGERDVAQLGELIRAGALMVIKPGALVSDENRGMSTSAGRQSKPADHRLAIGLVFDVGRRRHGRRCITNSLGRTGPPLRVIRMCLLISSRSGILHRYIVLARGVWVRMAPCVLGGVADVHSRKPGQVTG
jgi:hypothetical protein